MAFVSLFVFQGYVHRNMNIKQREKCPPESPTMASLEMRSFNFTIQNYPEQSRLIVEFCAAISLSVVEMVEKAGENVENTHLSMAVSEAAKKARQPASIIFSPLSEPRHNFCSSLQFFSESFQTLTVVNGLISQNGTQRHTNAEYLKRICFEYRPAGWQTF